MSNLSAYTNERLRECRRELGYAKLRLAAARGRQLLQNTKQSRDQLVRALADVYIWQARVDVLQ